MLIMRPTPATQQDFASRLKNVRAVARPQPDLVQEVQRAILLGFGQNFDSESDGGFRWARLAASTIQDRLRQGYGPGPILQRSRDYRASWTNPDAPDHVSEVTEWAGGWSQAEGSQHPLVGFHQAGTRRIPARPVNDLDLSAQEQLRQAVDTWIFQTLFVR